MFVNLDWGIDKYGRECPDLGCPNTCPPDSLTCEKFDENGCKLQPQCLPRKSCKYFRSKTLIIFNIICLI